MILTRQNIKETLTGPSSVSPRSLEIKPLDFSVDVLREMLWERRGLAPNTLRWTCVLDPITLADWNPAGDRYMLEEMVESGIECPFPGGVGEVFFVRSEWGEAQYGRIEEEGIFQRTMYRAAFPLNSPGDKGYGFPGGFHPGSELMAETAPLHVRVAAIHIERLQTKDLLTDGHLHFVVLLDVQKKVQGK